MQVLTYPDPFLKTKGVEVNDFSAHLRQIAEEMIACMYRSQGVGLASTQVGLKDRIFVFDTSETKDRPVVMINGTVVDKSRSKEPFEEGCLSVPGIHHDVIRPTAVTVRWHDLDGTEHVSDFENMEARVIQHELDHTNGFLFVDRLSQVTRMLLRKELQKLEEGHA